MEGEKVFKIDLPSFRSVQRVRLRKRNTLRKSSMYRLSIYNFGRGYSRRRDHFYSKIPKDHTHEYLNLQSRIKDAAALNRITDFFAELPRRKRGKKYTRWRNRIDNLKGELHANILEKECEEIFLTRQTEWPFERESLFAKLWEETWKTTKRFIIRWDDGPEVRFFESDCTCMLGRMYTASMRIKPIHLVNYVDMKKLKLEYYRKRVEECKVDVEDFLWHYLHQRKKNLNLDQKSTQDMCRWNSCSENIDKERNQKERDGKKAHKKDTMNNIMRGYE